MARKPPPKHSQFKKGQSGNQAGARAHNPAIKALQKLTVESYREIIELILSNNVAAVKTIAEDPNTTALQVGIAVAFLKAIKNGDYTVIERIAERIVGKIPDVVTVNQNTNMAISGSIKVFDKVALKAAMDEIEKDV
jgi:hypothetical protein